MTSQGSSITAFFEDLRTVKHSLYIESPFITLRRMDEIMPHIIKLKHCGVNVCINTRSPNEHNGVYIQQAQQAVKAFQDIGVTVLYTVGLHRKIAITDNILWEGSLNILSQNDSCEIMRRTVSIKLVNQMLNFVRARKYLN